MSACIYDDYPSPPEGTDTMLANARRIARLPDLEAAYLALADENTRLRDAMVKITCNETPSSNATVRRICDIARAALGLGETK